MNVSKFAIIVALTCVVFIILLTSPTGSVAQNVCPTSGIYGKDVGRDFFIEVVAVLKDVQQNDFAIDALTAWAPYEGTKAFWNPFATTWRLNPVCFFNCLKRNNSGQCTLGVQNYTSQSEGIRATANTLNLSYYNAIRSMLTMDVFDREALRVSLGTWGTCKRSGCDSLLNTWQSLYDRYKDIDGNSDGNSGGLDLTGYCQSKGFAAATLIENTVYGWKCKASNGTTYDINMYDACQWRHQGALPIPRYSDYSDPYSWKCYSQ